MGNNEIYQQNWNQIETEANGVVQITFRDLFVTFSRASPQLHVFWPARLSILYYFSATLFK